MTHTERAARAICYVRTGSDALWRDYLTEADAAVAAIRAAPLVSAWGRTMVDLGDAT